jgi:hypothetical protein
MARAFDVHRPITLSIRCSAFGSEVRHNCEERAMAEHEEIRQSQKVSKALANYLDMTTPRSQTPKQRPRRRDERPQAMRPPIDNRGLSLDEGNDFA